MTASDSAARSAAPGVYPLHTRSFSPAPIDTNILIAGLNPGCDFIQKPLNARRADRPHPTASESSLSRRREPGESRYGRASPIAATPKRRPHRARQNYSACSPRQ